MCRILNSYLDGDGPDQQFEGLPKANLADFNRHILPMVKENCVNCRGPEKQKGDFRIDNLNPDLVTGPDNLHWLEVFEVLSNGEMPPEDSDKYHLEDAERGAFVDWLSAEIQTASKVRRSEGGHTSFRRMTKYEYNYALQDLLGLPYEFVDYLPNESVSEDGFKNSSELLQMTWMQFDSYRKIALSALNKAVVKGERPEQVYLTLDIQGVLDRGLQSTKRQYIEEEHGNLSRPRLHDLKDDKGLFVKGNGLGMKRMKVAPAREKIPPASTAVVVLPPKAQFKLGVGTSLPDRGTMRVRLRVRRTATTPNVHSSLRLSIHGQTSNNANFTEVISKEDAPITAPLDKPQVVQFEFPLSEVARNPLRGGKKEKGVNQSEILILEHISNIPVSTVRGKRVVGTLDMQLHIDDIEVTGPHYEQWPPKSQTDIFGESASNGDEAKRARDIIERFMIRAWSRPVTTVEVDGYMKLFRQYRPQIDSFEDTVLEVLATTLASSNFIYLVEKQPSIAAKNKISNLELAKRLSLFLWSSIPDVQLVTLAHEKKLSDPKVLLSQVERMLEDPKAERFTQNFVQQWLGLDSLSNIDLKLIDDPNLRESIDKEPFAFFKHALTSGASVMDFIDSDYVVVNEALAKHYDIPDVYGPRFRRVPITEKMNRGGLLTGAAVLTMNANGIDSNPLKRGIWFLEHILNDPPPPPPPDVPEVDLTDPRILKMTLKEQIADHRNKPACMSCHAKIDPWGIAFENYDAFGKFRTQINNKPVDATSTLDNRKLAGMAGLKNYVLSARQDQFARAMVHKLTTYAVGRPLGFSDRDDVDKLTARFRRNGDKLNDLIKLIVLSPIFQEK